VDMGCGFKILTGEIHVQGFFFRTCPMNVTFRVSLTSFPDSMTCYGTYRNIGNVLIFYSRGS
jgi:hypothetical protein